MLVIFDCDGVLVDSEQLAAEAFSRALQSVGIDYSPERCFNDFCGHTLSECFAIVARAEGELPRNFPQLLLEVEQNLFKQQLKPVQGIENVLANLSERSIPFCVASNGGLQKVNRSLSLTGLNQFFNKNTIFSAEQVGRGKPAPDLFLFTASTLGFRPEQCIVVEDSNAGVRAAISAQMKILLYGEGITEVEGVQRFDSMNALTSMLVL